MAIRWNLNEIMFKRKLSNTELSKLTGLHKNTISKLKNSREMPNRLERKTLEKLCYALVVNPADLLTYEEDTVVAVQDESGKPIWINDSLLLADMNKCPDSDWDSTGKLEFIGYWRKRGFYCEYEGVNPETGAPFLRFCNDDGDRIAFDLSKGNKKWIHCLSARKIH